MMVLFVFKSKNGGTCCMGIIEESREDCEKYFSKTSEYDCIENYELIWTGELVYNHELVLEINKGIAFMVEE